MEVICFQDEAFYTLLEAITLRIKDKYATKEDKWISATEAMKKLRITSKSTLQKLRDTGAIRFSQPEKKLILYDVDSIYTYIEKYVKETF